MRKSILKDKSYVFAVDIVRFVQSLQKTHEYVLSKQILRSGTAIGASIREAEFAQSKLDFIHKLSISLKEANETEYWMQLLKDSDYLEDKLYQKLSSECKELISILVSSIKTAKSNNKMKRENEK